MIKDEGKYYLYRHVRLDKNEVFYVGIGTKEDKIYKTKFSEFKRAYKLDSRNIFWNRIIKKTSYTVQIILESNDYSFIQQKEIEFIKLYGRRNLGLGTLTNLTDGGEGNCNQYFSEETRRKMSLARKGIPLAKEYILKATLSKLGKHLSEETKKKISESKKGKILSEETRKKISISNKGRKVSIEQINKYKNTFLQKYLFYQIDMEDNIIAIFKNKIEIKEKGFNMRKVRQCYLNPTETYKGFKWRREFTKDIDI